MTALVLIGIWLSVSIIAGLLIGRGIETLRSADSETRGPQVMRAGHVNQLLAPSTPPIILLAQ